MPIGNSIGNFTVPSSFIAYKAQISQFFPEITSLVNTFLIILGVSVVLFQVLKIVFWIQLQLEKKVLIEVTPLRETEQSSYSTQQLFKLIHSLGRQRSLIHRFFDLHSSYSLEIAATKEQGIRYLIQVPEDDYSVIKKSLYSYLPGVKIKVIDEYLHNLGKHSSIIQFVQARHYAIPLKSQYSLEKFDPMAYITGSMTKLGADELMVFQLIVQPADRSIAKLSQEIKSGIAKNLDLHESLSKSTVLHHPIFNLLKAILQMLMFPVGLLVFVSSGGKQGPLLEFHSAAPKQITNIYDEELSSQVKNKLDEQLFSVNMQLLVKSEMHKNIYLKKKGFISALTSFASSNQSMKTIKLPSLQLLHSLQVKTFSKRASLPLFRSILSITEIADLYHFPFTTVTKTEGMQKVHSKELPAPLSLKQDQKKDIYFANNTYGGTITKIGLDIDERRRHMYILGATGTGKSTLLLSMISQDILNNKGICVIDPHGDLIEKVLQCIPENRIQDVIYFNPDDVEHPIGLNLLELPQNISETQMIREKELITESIISLFHKLYSDKFSGPRMEYILRNTIHTAFTTPNPTLFTIYKLLINEPYRKQVTSKLTDPNLSDFWKYEFSKAGDYQKVKMISPITNKIGRFLFSSTGKRILEQEKSSINFDDIMDSGKMLLCNLSKGKIGEDNSEVFGILLMAKIQLAALKRARTNADYRRDFYLYVDEFQNFATPAFAQILSEARKYKLNAILAHQTTSQLEDKSLVNVTLANTGTVICFRTANPEDERLILPQFIPYVQKGEIDKLPSFHFYIKINAITPEEPFSGETTPVVIQDNPTLVQRVIENSRKNYTCTTAPIAEIQQEKVVIAPKESGLTKVLLPMS
jgi:hypothetical protein